MDSKLVMKKKTISNQLAMNLNRNWVYSFIHLFALYLININ